MSIGSRSGRAVSSIQMILPRYCVSPICEAIIANTRLDVPESPSDSRLPSAASASSTTTTTGPIARSTDSTRSRLPSVSPTYFDRKFFRITHGTPISPLTHCARNDLPVPTGPHIR